MQPSVVTLAWADGEYPFALNIGQVRELEAIKNIGVAALYSRLTDGAWYGDDAYHIIRLGLIGGGMTPAEAMRKCETYVLDRPLAESVPFATAILMHRLFKQFEGKAEASETDEATPLAE